MITIPNTPKALIVEDDDRVIGSIEDTLFSIGHDHDWATNQHDARRMLTKNDYDYVLLDLEIPAKPNRGGADKEFGCNLLRDIQQIKGRRRTPVVVMTANSSDCLDLTTELYANGASEFIAKPFSNKGRTLANVIRKVLASPAPPPWAATRASDTPQSAATCFAGGEMAFYPNRVTLLGITIISDRGTGQCMAVLEQLRRQDGRGRFRQMSGEELAAAICARGGVGTITGCIQTLRRNIGARLRKTGITVGREDVICHDEQGYRLRDWIVVYDGDAPSDSCDAPTVPAGSSNVPADVGDAVPAGPSPNRRQHWILGQLQQGVELQRVMLEREFNIATKTAKRDLSELVQWGLIEYLRCGRSGCYRLRSQRKR